MNAWLEDKVDNGPYWFRWTFCFLFAFVVMSGIFSAVTFGVFLLISFIIWEIVPFLTDGYMLWFLVRMILALSLIVTIAFIFSKEGKEFVNNPSGD